MLTCEPVDQACRLLLPVALVVACVAARSVMKDRILIVGAGPVGLSAAAFLRQLGLPVLVLEAEASLHQDMRASTFHPPTLELLAKSGATSLLLEQGTEVRQWQYLDWVTGESIVFDLALLSDVTHFPCRLQCEQFRLTEALIRLMAEDPDADIRFASPVVAVTQDSSGVEVRIDTPDGVRLERGTFLIAADGNSSTVRKSLGLAFAGNTYPSTSITLILDGPIEHLVPGLLGVNYCWTENDRFSIMRVGRKWRTGYSPRPGQSVDDALGDAYVDAHLRRLGLGDQGVSASHRSAYRVHRRLLDSFRHGRILFAGDAAHLNSPSGGMGMNSGIHDAYLLAQCLWRTSREEGGRALDEYAQRRRAAALHDVQAASDKHHKMHRTVDAKGRVAAWARLKQIADDPARARDYLLTTSMLGPALRDGLLPLTGDSLGG